MKINFSLSTFFFISLVLAIIAWILWGLGIYINIYGDPGYFWARISLSFTPQIVLTIVALGIFVIKRLKEEGVIA